MRAAARDLVSPEQRIANHEQGEAGIPKRIEPGAGLRVGVERTAARKQHDRDRHERGEEVPARKTENGAKSRSAECDGQRTTPGAGRCRCGDKERVRSVWDATVGHIAAPDSSCT